MASMFARERRRISRPRDAGATRSGTFAPATRYSPDALGDSFGRRTGAG
jgi:hypothetical protein